jgi:hypothetical protein
MNFKSKDELIQFVNHQVNVLLKNDKYCLNDNMEILYAEINKSSKNRVLGLLEKYKIRYENHMNNNYWIYIDKKMGVI